MVIDQSKSAFTCRLESASNSLSNSLHIDWGVLLTGCRLSKDYVSLQLKPPNCGKGENQYYHAKAEDTMIVAGVALEEHPGIYHLPNTFSPGGIDARGPVIIFSDPLQKGWRGSRRGVHSGLVVAVLADQVDVAEDVLLGVPGPM